MTLAQITEPVTAIGALEAFKIALLLWIVGLLTKGSPVTNAAGKLAVARMELLIKQATDRMATQESVDALRIEVAQIAKRQLEGRGRSTDKLPVPPEEQSLEEKPFNE